MLIVYWQPEKGKFPLFFQISVGEKASVQSTGVEENKNEPIKLENDSDDVDKIMSEILQDLVSPQHHQSNLIPCGVLAPFLRYCQNL